MYDTTNADATAQVRDRAARTRPERELRGLVAELDSLVEACEEAHLEHRHRVGPELAARAGDVFATARTVLDRPHIRVPPEPGVMPISDLLDTAWSLEDEAFDRLLPVRARLPEDVPDEDGGPTRHAAVEGS